MTSRKPDFKRGYMLANEILATTGCVSTFPYSMKLLAKEQADVQICSYNKATTKFNVPICAFGSDSAHLEEFNGAHIIFFNEKEKKYRIRFSLGHELAHLLFGHEMNLTREDPLYGVQEVEAGCFAAQLIMPEQLLRECQRRGYKLTIDYVMKSFGVSEDAAEKRIRTILTSSMEWKSASERKYDDIILEKYDEFLNKVAP